MEIRRKVLYMIRGCGIQWTMDRILYFRMTGKKEYTKNYRVQVFRKNVWNKDIFYLQVCGYPPGGSVLQIKDELQKAVDRMLSYEKRGESDMPAYLMYEENFEEWLEGMQYEKEWRRLWRLPMYEDYPAVDNVRRMLESIPKGHFPQEAWILGCGIQMQEWLPQLAGKLRSLTFYVEFVTGGLEKLREQLTEEWGLVSAVQLVTPGELRKQRLQSTQPVLVMDYSGSQVISVTGLKRGSIWLDMGSVETKRHAMEDRNIGVMYISLKNLWKREMLQTLDTISNFEYNTGVKIDSLGGGCQFGGAVDGIL